ncbi:MAG: hypothetical protein AAF802_01675 [Planctomycetota bacterium]
MTLTHPVEALLAIPLLVTGVSHILHPVVWKEFFEELHAMGSRGVLWRTFALELWPAAVIVTFHQQWSWPGLPITLYGHALMVKVIVSLCFPALGLRSLAMAKTHGKTGFRSAGIVLCLLALLCLYRLLS